MRDSAKYVKIVEWSDEDQCYLGSAPGLVYGGCHGDDEKVVLEELCQIVEEAIALYRKDGKPLPSPTSGRDSANKPQTVAWRVTFADSAPGGGSCRAEGRTILERRTGWTWTGECWTGG